MADTTQPRQRSEAAIKLDTWMDQVDANRERHNREADLPHPDRRMAYQWTYPCKACKQMMRLSWDSGEYGSPPDRLYHNCENTLDGEGDERIECGAYHIFQVDWYFQIDLRRGRLSCEKSDLPIEECECAECAARRAVASPGASGDTETHPDA